MSINCNYGSVRITILPPTKYFFYSHSEFEIKSLQNQRSVYSFDKIWNWMKIFSHYWSLSKNFSWITFELRIFFNEHNVSREAENASWEPLPRSRPVQSRIRNELCDWKETSNDCSAQICQVQILDVKVLEPATARKILLRKTEVNPHLSFF